MLEILLVIGGAFIGMMILYLMARTFWARTVITLLSMIACLLMALLSAASASAGGLGAIPGVVFAVGIFFLFGKYLGKKTGTVVRSVTINDDLSGGNIKHTKKTYTLTIFVVSIIAGVGYAILCQKSVLFGILIPLVIIAGKAFGIWLHLRSRESEIDMYADDTDDNETTTPINFR